MDVLLTFEALNMLFALSFGYGGGYLGFSDQSVRVLYVYPRKVLYFSQE